jgi:DNA mismatch repair protein MutS2
VVLTGRTIYVEPSEVVELTNRLKDLRGQLAEEENRVYYAMCRAIHAHREVVQAAVRAAAELDVLTAKARLGMQLGGIIPEVSAADSYRL